MAEYVVKLTDYAISQVAEAVAYISKTLLAPDVARKWSAHIQSEIVSLSSMPFRFPLVDEEPWHTEGIRKMTVRNFLIYYWVNEAEKTVWVTAVIYGRRDQLIALQNMPIK